MEMGEIPELPKFSQADLFDLSENIVNKEFATAKSKFVFYDNENGNPRFYFHKLDENFFAALVHYLSDLNHHKLYEFLKLVLEAVRLVKQNNKKGFLQAERIETFIKRHF
jgi:hypothetical protein